MREVLLLWLFVVFTLIVIAAVVLLAVGVVLAVVWLLWKAVNLVAKAWRRALARQTWGEVRFDDVSATQPFESLVPRRMRAARAQRLVRVPVGLVPPSTCLAQRNREGLERSRSARARRGDD